MIEHRSDLIFFRLVVDEINRGNLAKIFGELYFLLEYRDEAIDLIYSSDNVESFSLPRNVVIIFRDRAPRTARSLSWTRRCAGASDSLRCTQRGSRRKLLLRRWFAARKYPQRVADLHHALNAAIDDPDVPVRALVFHASGGPQ
ncbi:hypothetical protein NOU13_27235 [Rhodococcus erythropolis]|uniref:hypothetical protein n=1 Tax=Rhodococcus erythropolis TaxID=1833 RepID=UPI00210E6CB8|nr:hypothetical protein [Rhodococcus erythropolis]MCQ4128203.1 hypothetical protein [Rhodococcus erythropolis]